MRLDKFLWSVRKFKTRSLAADAIRKNKVNVNEVPSKASREVKAGDLIDFKKDGITYSVEVIGLPKSRVGAKLVPDYIIEKTSEEELEKLQFINLMHKVSRKRGSGRPTKKERRDMDDFIED